MTRQALIPRLLVALVLLGGALVAPPEDARGIGLARALVARLHADAGAAEARPRLLSETGLYLPGPGLQVDPRNRPFTPQYPLWSDGAAKRRWVRLPEGSTIDVTRLDAWNFPVGTRFWKEFAFGGRRAETRMFTKVGPDRWEFASYVWNADQTDATRAPDEGVMNVAEVAPDRFHSIPAVADCRACHDSGRTEVLGFSALQLSTDRDPGAPHAEPVTPDMITLRTLVDEQRLSPARPDLVTAPPRIAADDPRTRSVLGYLSTNCGSCHNPSSEIASLGLSLKYRLEAAAACAPDAIATTIGRPGHWDVPDAPPGASMLIHPGRPEHSAVFARMRSRRPSSQMPAIGTVLRDQVAVDLVSAWITENAPAWEQRLATCAQQTRR